MSGRKPKVHEEEHENHERWAVSYADMMTVLVGLFIVMYAMSQVDQTKFEALAGSLAAGFGNASPTVLTGASGIMKDAGAVPASIKPAGETNPIAPAAELTGEEQNLADARNELERLEAMRDQIEANLVAAGVGQQVSYGIDSRGLIVGLIANDFFFETGSAVLKPAAQTVLNATGPVISVIPDEISVEGHADAIPISGRYPTNWELSADRATQVLRHLVEVDGIAGSRISAVSYGDARPLTSTDGSDSLAINRRVDLVIRSPLAEPVRALIPVVISANEG